MLTESKKYNKSRVRLMRLLNKVHGYIRQYAQSNTFHGVNHTVISGKRHPVEALFWIVVVLAFGAGALWIIEKNYQRYRANPTVITLDKNYRAWNISFPATTFCFVDKLDKDKAQAVVKRKWQVQKGSKFEYYMRFLRVVSNSSYYNLGDFKEFQNDEQLINVDLASLMNEVNFDVEKMSPTLFSEKKYYFFKVKLEMGICYSVCSVLTREFLPEAVTSFRNKKNVVTPVYEPEHCTYLHILCYGILENLPRDIMIYVHSPYEVPVLASPYHTLYLGHQMELAYNQFDIKASHRVRQLQPEQRHCYFFDESLNSYIKYYSYNTCMMECRRALTMKFCNCVPHFYRNQAGQPACNVKQLLCIHEKLPELLHLSQTVNETDRNCKCYRNCEDSTVVLDYERMSNQITNFVGHILTSTRYRWAIETYSKIRFKRDIIFGMDELLVSLGGTVCFFLGGSLMSGVELIYFFTVRLIRFIKR